MLIARNLMQSPVSTVGINSTLHEAIMLMQEKDISGLPVMDRKGEIVGMLTEGDLLRRAELDTEKVRSGWLDFFMSSGAKAEEYTRSHSQLVADVMTWGATVISPDLPLEKAVSIMQTRRIKRLPVVDGAALIGIVSRHDLLAALAQTYDVAAVAQPRDCVITNSIRRQLDVLKWGCCETVSVQVDSGVVTLSGVIMDGRERAALHALASNTPGVKRVIEKLTWVDLTTGTVIDKP